MLWNGTFAFTVAGVSLAACRNVRVILYRTAHQYLGKHGDLMEK